MTRDRQGRFAKRIQPARLLLWHLKSAPHCRGWVSRRARLSAAVWAHIEALRADICKGGQGANQREAQPALAPAMGRDS